MSADIRFGRKFGQRFCRGQERESSASLSSGQSRGRGGRGRKPRQAKEGCGSAPSVAPTGARTSRMPRSRGPPARAMGYPIPPSAAENTAARRRRTPMRSERQSPDLVQQPYSTPGKTVCPIRRHNLTSGDSFPKARNAKRQGHRFALTLPLGASGTASQFAAGRDWFAHCSRCWGVIGAAACGLPDARPFCVGLHCSGAGGCCSTWN